MSTQHQIIEHIVIHKVKPDVDSTKIAAMIDELNGLSSLDLIIHLSVGVLLESTSTLLTFTHMLHCRFGLIDDLQVYFDHLEHLRVVADIPSIVEDIFFVDRISNCISDSPKPGSAMKVNLLKLKQDLVENEKSKLVDQVIERIKSEFKLVEFISFGENFSHDMEKGFSICMITAFHGPTDLDSDAELRNSHKVKVEDLLESELVVEYVLPLPKVANH